LKPLALERFQTLMSSSVCAARPTVAADRIGDLYDHRFSRLDLDPCRGASMQCTTAGLTL
jgi:hypothetical protein